MFALEKLSYNEFSDLLKKADHSFDPNFVIIPQANTIETVLNSLQILYNSPGLTDGELACELGLGYRQGGYYANACSYLGLIERINDGRLKNNYPTLIGKSIIESTPKMRSQLLIIQLLRHEVFYHFINLYNVDRCDVNKDAITTWLINTYMMEDNKTPARRSSTIYRWIVWLFKNCIE